MQKLAFLKGMKANSQIGNWVTTGLDGLLRDDLWEPESPSAPAGHGKTMLSSTCSAEGVFRSLPRALSPTHRGQKAVGGPTGVAALQGQLGEPAVSTAKGSSLLGLKEASQN